jgi:hypothetical protein
VSNFEILERFPQESFLKFFTKIERTKEFMFEHIIISQVARFFSIGNREQEAMSADEDVPTETSRLVGGNGEQTNRKGTKVCSIIKWVLCAGVGWTLIGAITVLIVSKFFQESRWGAKSYEIEYLPYFDDFKPANATTNTSVSVAFIGNGMQYVNDLPRFMGTLSEGNIAQNSCYRNGTFLKNLTIHGNGMSEYWNTPAALIEGTNVYDFGACTVKQLLFGKDEHLERLARKGHFKHDPLIGNPCLEFPEYLGYLNKYYAKNKPRWDFVVLNDNSRSPSRRIERQKSLKALRNVYVPWFQETGAIPVILDTHAYSDPTGRTISINVPTFTSITYEGCVEYAALVESFLPPSQKPRIAPVGIVFLTVWEEDHALWERLFRSDRIHNSPLGTFLQGCVLHYTLMGRMPSKDDVLRDDMSELWQNARMMQPSGQPTSPFPSKVDAEHVYNIAERVLKNKHLPKALFIREDEDTTTLASRRPSSGPRKVYYS